MVGPTLNTLPSRSNTRSNLSNIQAHPSGGMKKLVAKEPTKQGLSVRSPRGRFRQSLTHNSRREQNTNTEKNKNDTKGNRTHTKKGPTRREAKTLTTRPQRLLTKTATDHQPHKPKNRRNEQNTKTTPRGFEPRTKRGPATGHTNTQTPKHPNKQTLGSKSLIFQAMWENEGSRVKKSWREKFFQWYSVKNGC